MLYLRFWTEETVRFIISSYMKLPKCLFRFPWPWEICNPIEIWSDSWNLCMPKQTFSKISPKVLRVKTSEMTGTLLSVNVWVFFFQCLPVSHCHHSFFSCSCPLFTSPRLTSAYSLWPQPCILYCTLYMVITQILIFFFFCGTGVWTQVFMLPKQVL
jgi:hypothetical protein